MKWLAWFRRRKWERGMDAEMRFHIESQIGDYVRQGLSREEGERRARREFGALELAKDECRDEIPLAWLDHLKRDVRLAVRSLRQSPGFALAAILTLALGIGANTGIFSAVYAVLLKPLPYRDSDQLFMNQVDLAVRKDLGSLAGTIQNYLEWRTQATVFSDVAAVQPAEWNMTGTGEPERVGGARVSTNFFSFLGVPLARGHGFVGEEEQPGKDRVVVISDSLWRRRFAADPEIIGKTIALQGEGHVIVGVAPASLLVPTGDVLYLHFAPRIDVWKPQAPTSEELQGESWNQIILLRLRPGEFLEHGRQQLHALLNPPGSVGPERPEGIPRLTPIREIYAGQVRLRLLLLLAASGLLLLIACTNIANLFLARVASRSGEFATRIALGASRSRVVAQLLTESTMLAVIGGGSASAIAYAAVRLLIANGPADVGLLSQARVNIPVLLFTTLMSLITGVICGVVPAWQVYRKDAAVNLQEGARAALGGARAARIRQVLVGVQMALGTALLASAALLLHSFVKVIGIDRGYDVERVLTVSLDLSGERYTQGAQRVAFYREITQRIGSLPGVLSTGAISDIPVAGDSASQVTYLGTDTDERIILQRPIAGFRQVTPGYFSASGSTLIAGRFFTEHDPVTTALVSESLAMALWPGEPPDRIPGHTLRQGSVKAPLLTVLGLIRDVQAGAVDKQLLPQLYRPYLPPRTTGQMTVVVRTSQDPSNLVPAIRAQIRSMDPNVPIPAVRTMREVLSSTVAERRFQMALTVLFAIIALLLGAVGIYGVVSYAVTQRTREIGLRIALGAVRQNIVSWVLATGMRPVLTGLIVGLGGAWAIASTLRSLLYGISPGDPAAFLGVTFVLLCIAACACYLPARRASRLNPVMALRHE